MNLYLFSGLFLLVLLFLFSYAIYYFINPSNAGEKILHKYNIPYPAVIAHRGASLKAPESTIPAFKIASRNGVDYVEVDLQRSKDGKLVIFHDLKLERLSDVKQVFPERENYKLNNFTYQELKKLDFGSWYNKKYPKQAKESYQGLQIISLSELLGILKQGKNKTGLCLEFKYPHLYPGLEKEAIELLERKGWLNNQQENKKSLLFMSFNINSLDCLKNIAPEVPRLLLVNDNMIGKRKWSKWLDLAEGRVNGIGAKGFVSWPWHITAAHKRNLFVYSYVINKAWQLKFLSHFKADGYITDHPEMIINYLNKLKEMIVN